MITIPQIKDITHNFNSNFKFAEQHMLAIRKALGNLPSRLFLDIETATAKQDMEQATDLVLSVHGGDIAVRIRRNNNWHNGIGRDWSVRAVCRGWKTEINKLKEGFGRWYFMGWSSNDHDELAGWYLIDLDKVRECKILDDPNNSINPNGDGTSGMYIPVAKLYAKNCIVAQSQKPT